MFSEKVRRSLTSPNHQGPRSSQDLELEYPCLSQPGTTIVRGELARGWAEKQFEITIYIYIYNYIHTFSRNQMITKCEC